MLRSSFLLAAVKAVPLTGVAGKACDDSQIFVEQASLCSAGENKWDFYIQTVKVFKSKLKGD